MSYLHRYCLSIILIIFLAIPLSACGGSGGKISTPDTLEEAAQLVIDEIILPEQLENELILFGLPNPLTAEDKLNVYAADDLSLPGDEIVIGSKSWFFWIDDAPFALFSHSTRYVLIDIETGEITTSEENWWPVLNGESLWTDDVEYSDPENWLYSNLESDSESGSLIPPSYKIAGPANIETQQLPPGGIALVVNGWSPGERGETSLRDSERQMSDILTKSGFDVSNIKPGDSFTRGEIELWINNRVKSLAPGGTALIYLTGHGNDVDGKGMVMVGGEAVFESDLEKWLADIHPGLTIIVIVDSCHAGAWKDGLKKVADLNVTSTGASQIAYIDRDLSNDPNPTDKGNEYTSGYVEDWNQIIESPVENERALDRVETNGTSYWEEVAAMSHDSAAAKDCMHLRGMTSPEAVRGDPATTHYVPIYPLLDYVNAAPGLINAFIQKLVRDGFGDSTLSDPAWAVDNDVKGADIDFYEAFVTAFGMGRVDEWYNESYFDCDTQVGNVLTICANGAGPMPEGEILIGLMVLDSNIPLEPSEQFYQYGFVFDSDNDPGNNFTYFEPFTLDYFQGTDLWYVVYDSDGQWYLEASTASGSYIASNARAAIIENILVYFIPMSEFSVEVPSYRFSAFSCDVAGWGSGFCYGDVSGVDATVPPVPIPEDVYIYD